MTSYEQYLVYIILMNIFKSGGYPNFISYLLRNYHIETRRSGLKAPHF